MYITADRRVVIGWLLIFLLCVVGCIWILVSNIIASQTTGLLDITSASPQAGLIIGQSNHQAASVGVGSAKVRLSPGTYQVSAVESGKHASAIAKVYKKQSTH